MKRQKNTLRKVMLSLLALTAMSAFATDVEVTWTANEKGYSSGQALDGVTAVIDSKTSITFKQNSGANGPKYYSSGEAVRLYPANTMTVSGENISKIVLTFGSGDNSNTLTASPGSYSNGTWSGTSNSVTFTVGGSSGHRRIAAVTVTYTTGTGGDPTVEVKNPVLPDEFTFWPNTNETPKAVITLEPPVEGLVVCYTTDGSDPVPGVSEEFTASTDIVFHATTTLKAMSYAGNNRSDVVSATYTLGKTVKSVKAFKQIGEGNEARLYLSSGMEARVIYNNDGEVYLRDNSGAICFKLSRSSYNPTPSSNQHVAGWIIGEYHEENGMPTFIATENTTTDYILFANPVTEAEIQPLDIGPEELGAYYGDWVRLDNMNAINDGSTLKVEQDDFTYNISNPFNLSDDLYIIPADGSLVAVSGIAMPNMPNDDIAMLDLNSHVPIEILEEPSSIGALKTDESVTSNGVIYNICGQRVTRVSHGMFIINGKKVLIK